MRRDVHHALPEPSTPAASNIGKSGMDQAVVELGKVKANIAAAEQAAGRAAGCGDAGRRLQDVRGTGNPAAARGRPSRIRRKPRAGGRGQMAWAQGRIPRHRAASDRTAAIQQGEASGGAVRRHRDGRPRQDRRRARQGDRAAGPVAARSTSRSTPAPSRRRRASSHRKRWPSSSAAATPMAWRSAG